MGEKVVDVKEACITPGCTHEVEETPQKVEEKTPKKVEEKTSKKVVDKTPKKVVEKTPKKVVEETQQQKNDVKSGRKFADGQKVVIKKLRFLSKIGPCTVLGYDENTQIYKLKVPMTGTSMSGYVV